MKLLFQMTLVFLLAGLFSLPAGARSKRVGQIPNGNKFSCANCHVNPAGGGTRNAFGKQVENSYLDNNGNVIWGPALAALDADGDGKTNGEELQDPNGTWKIGQQNPGDPNLVSNPGDPTSTTAVMENSGGALPKTLEIAQNFPNPFNPETTIRFLLPEAAAVTLTIYNQNGQQIATLFNGPLAAGLHRIRWNSLDASGNRVAAGIYFCRLQANRQSKIRKMVLLP